MIDGRIFQENPTASDQGGGIEPYNYTSDGITIVNEIDPENIDKEAIYVFCFDTSDVFEDDFEVTHYIDWCVGVPKAYEAFPE